MKYSSLVRSLILSFSWLLLQNKVLQIKTSGPNIEGLLIHDEGDEEGFSFDVKNDGDEAVDLRWCLVGRFLCDRLVHLKTMKEIVADMLRPVKGLQSKNKKRLIPIPFLSQSQNGSCIE